MKCTGDVVSADTTILVYDKLALRHFAPITGRATRSRLRAQIYRTAALSDRRSNVGVREIVTFKQQRFTCELCERIGKAIADIQLGGMAAAFTEIAIGLTCNSSLGFGYGLNDDFCASLIRSSNRRLATGSRLASMMTAASTDHRGNPRSS